MYSPREDSYFLAEETAKLLKKEKNKNIKILDLGTGTAFQAENIFNLGFKNILCSDIDKEAVKSARKLGFKAVKSDLFSKIKKKFDLIVFNPPYLPEDKYDKEKDTAGGKKGDETILRFLKQAKSHLKKNGKILLLISSLTPKPRIKAELKNQSLKSEKIAVKNLFFEQLEILEIRAE